MLGELEIRMVKKSDVVLDKLHQSLSSYFALLLEQPVFSRGAVNWQTTITVFWS